MQKIHGIDLLQTLPAALNQEEINHKCCNKVTACEDVTICEADLIRDERGEESEVKVPELCCCVNPGYGRGGEWKHTQLDAEQ